MKGIALLGIVLVLLGVLSFIVPIPHSERHGVKVGDTRIGVQTETSEKVPPLVGALLLAGGIAVLALGARKS